MFENVLDGVSTRSKRRILASLAAVYIIRSLHKPSYFADYYSYYVSLKDETNDSINPPLTIEEVSFHSPRLSYVPLQDWEMTSAGPERNCSPPAGTPSYCCLGSIALFGQVVYASDRCFNNPENLLLPYQTLQNMSIQWLNDHPLPVDTIRQCDSCQIIQMLLQHNLTLSFIGDSVMRQVASGWECELRRNNYNVASTIVPRDSAPGFEWRHRWLSTYYVTVTRGAQTTTMSFCNLFRPHADVVGEFLTQHPSNIVMFDHGLHYLEREKHKIRPEYAATLQVLFRNVSLVLWRETSTQHYATPGGYYTESLPNQTECSAAVESERNSTSYHLASVRHMVHDMNWTLVDALAPNFTNSPSDADRHEIVMLPFRQYTLPLHNLHAGYPDCSHYCSSPFLWVPIWRGLRLALDRSVLNGKFQKVANEVIP